MGFVLSAPLKPACVLASEAGAIIGKFGILDRCLTAVFFLLILVAEAVKREEAIIQLIKKHHSEHADLLPVIRNGISENGPQ